jgi:hypothetical protein
MNIISAILRSATLAVVLTPGIFAQCYDSKDIDCRGEPVLQDIDVGYKNEDPVTHEITFVVVCKVPGGYNCLGSGQVSVQGDPVSGAGLASGTKAVNCGTIRKTVYNFPATDSSPAQMQAFCANPIPYQDIIDTKTPCSVSKELINCII